ETGVKITPSFNAVCSHGLGLEADALPLKSSANRSTLTEPRPEEWTARRNAPDDRTRRPVRSPSRRKIHEEGIEETHDICLGIGQFVSKEQASCDCEESDDQTSLGRLPTDEFIETSSYHRRDSDTSG